MARLRVTLLDGAIVGALGARGWTLTADADTTSEELAWARTALEAGTAEARLVYSPAYGDPTAHIAEYLEDAHIAAPLEVEPGEIPDGAEA